jgi:DNA mismatch repair protein MutS
LAIARAVAEHLHEVVGARTLFATHYYELARAAQGWPQAQNLHVRAEEHEGAVVFLYKVAAGMADRSFALHVARMAGMPEPITLRAADLLAAVAAPGNRRDDADGIDAPSRRVDPEESANPTPPTDYLPRGNQRAAQGGHARLHVAEPGIPVAEELVEAVLDIDLASTTPIEALNRLLALQQQARTLAQQATQPRPHERHGYRA